MNGLELISLGSHLLITLCGLYFYQEKNTSNWFYFCMGILWTCGNLFFLATFLVQYVRIYKKSFLETVKLVSRRMRRFKRLCKKCSHVKRTKSKRIKFAAKEVLTCNLEVIEAK